MSCILSFKREAKVYVVYSGSQYNLDVSEINFNQTFTEHTYSNKTIQVQNMFEQSVINKANPANFDLTFPAIRETDLRILYNRALDYKIFDLYVQTNQDTFLIAGCVITTAIFIMEELRPLSIGINGEAVKVSRVGGSTYIIPGTVRARSNTRTYSTVSYIDIQLDNQPSEDSITRVAIELTNSVEWTPYTTVNDAIIDGFTMYPKRFTVKTRDLSGSFSGYNVRQLKWSESAALFIRAGQKVGNSFYGFEFDIEEVSFQNTVNTEEIFSQSYNWRMTQNPISLHQVIAYLGLVDDSGAILDSWSLAILDSFGQPLLESI